MVIVLYVVQERKLTQSVDKWKQCADKMEFCSSVTLYCVGKKGHKGNHTFKISDVQLKRGF